MYIINEKAIDAYLASHTFHINADDSEDGEFLQLNADIEKSVRARRPAYLMVMDHIREEMDHLCDQWELRLELATSDSTERR